MADRRPNAGQSPLAPLLGAYKAGCREATAGEETVRDALRSVPGANAEQLQACHVDDAGRLEVLVP